MSEDCVIGEDDGAFLFPRETPPIAYVRLNYGTFGRCVGLARITTMEPTHFQCR